MQFLQSLQEQVSGYQNLIKLLNSFSELDSLIFWGTILHIFGPKCRTDCIPQLADFIFSLLK